MVYEAKTTKIEIRVSESTKTEFRLAAERAGEDLTEFMIAGGKARAESIVRDVASLNDGQTPIRGYRYIVKEGKKVKFKENGVKAIPAILAMYAHDDAIDEVAEALHLPLAAILEAKYFCETHPEEVDLAVNERH